MTAVFRRATPADAVALTDLEEAANRLALAHVFGDLPFPRADVEAHWVATLADPAVTVEVVEVVEVVGAGEGGLDCFAAYDDSILRHLAVHPQRWGGGLARAAVERAVTAIRAGGATPRLWCLAENHRAAGLYAHLGWVRTGVERTAGWPPHPVEQQWVLLRS